MVTRTTKVPGAKIDWSYVEQCTEVPRTYLMIDKTGKEFYKMYKPSIAREVMAKKGWRGKIVSTVNLR